MERLFVGLDSNSSTRFTPQQIKLSSDGVLWAPLSLYFHSKDCDRPILVAAGHSVSIL